MSITVFTFQNGAGDEDTFTTQNVAEANEYARENKRAMIANTYEFDDSEMVEDFRGDEAPDDDDDAPDDEGDDDDDDDDDDDEALDDDDDDK